MNMRIEDLVTDISFLQHVLNPNFKENGHWTEWAKSSEENALLYEEARSVILNFYHPLSQEEYQEAAMDFKKKIDLTPADKYDILKLYDQRREKRNKWFWYAAASVVLFMSLFLFLKWRNEQIRKQKVANSEPTQKFIKKEVGKGQKLTITFQDGTRVKLNSESHIIFPETFSRKKRVVTLSGEAFFEVSHYDNWPFIVKTKNVQTIVLGTAFNISSYPEDPFVKIALVEGSVSIKTENQKPVNLTPDKMAKINTDGISVTAIDIPKVTAWKDNKIVFDRASFDEVQTTLERWYNVKFIYRNKPVFKGGYTGEFKNLSLDALLKGMSSGKFNYRIDGKTVYIN